MTQKHTVGELRAKYPTLEVKEKPRQGFRSFDPWAVLVCHELELTKYSPKRHLVKSEYRDYRYAYWAEHIPPDLSECIVVKDKIRIILSKTPKDLDYLFKIVLEPQTTLVELKIKPQ